MGVFPSAAQHDVQDVSEKQVRWMPDVGVLIGQPPLRKRAISMCEVGILKPKAVIFSLRSYSWSSIENQPGDSSTSTPCSMRRHDKAKLGLTEKRRTGGKPSSRSPGKSKYFVVYAAANNMYLQRIQSTTVDSLSMGWPS
ncbi:hypothetical protein H112_01014 [Trichophyton rubrum D6]|uniref:Uncharacterized protein n=2 Tax=Trichophyton rubrum TaxID=5551 RepID=F2SXY1_TRIRC|nr:uncharacterized protein TERG_07439 [Trichophyton rubrum CBS 118892]EZF26926.1 hypothetical protein H100_01015 [Trichophyton rubrum MR850]EZF45966.1 hypothetical protein H102_01006 [Trichophyton rubrum CBS 100081]EZF56655.1 hypothetical protein H103_01015 [Trichophyton rubrum CBS 288.86]EZF67222.1 hypothetical protein H104_00999 [Trichophyton rubrum CBS 289.86]EZF88526.1 hypothetical protein H110_01015 [Trichophyton rubrum MR1448]EZF99331.1 hypothetical protein H113_01016 [Trichophyton rubr